MKKSIRIATALMIAGAVLGAVSAGLWRYLDTPAGPEQVERYVEIPSGTAFIEVARILEREGIIRGVRRFRWLAWLKGTEKQIKAGDYTFHPAMKPSEVLDRLVKGESQTVTVTIPEGYTMGRLRLGWRSTPRYYLPYPYIRKGYPLAVNICPPASYRLRSG